MSTPRRLIPLTVYLTEDELLMLLDQTRKDNELNGTAGHPDLTVQPDAVAAGILVMWLRGRRERAEGELSTGVAYLRSKATAPAQLVRVPLASNAAIRALLASGDQPVGTPEVRQPDATPDDASKAAASPEAARALALFASGADIGQIVHELRGIEPGRGGRRYQDAAREIQILIRTAIGGR